MNVSLVNSFFTRLENNPVLEVMTKEVLGINAPKTAIVRSGDEMVDVAFNELGNTAGFFGGGFLLDKLLNRFYAAEAKGMAGQQAKLWKYAGKSVALCSVLFALMWAMPFFRNYLTAVRTGTDDYTEVIGSRAGGASKPRSSSEFEAKKRGYLTTALTTLGIGAAIAALSVVGSRMAIKRGIPLGKSLEKALKKEAKTAGDKVKRWIGNAASWVQKTIGLQGGEFKKFGDIHAALFWGLPAYGGWIHASRDGYERKEQLLKAANFFIWFFALPMAIRRGFVKRYPKKLTDFIAKHNVANPQNTIKRVTKALIEGRGKGGKIVLNAAEKAQAIKTWERQSVISLLSSLVLLGVSPAILNIWLTKRRIAHDHSQAVHYSSAANLPSGNLVRKSFEEFVLPSPHGQGYNQAGW